MLAIEKKHEIEKYVFKRLVSNGITFYNEKIKEAFENRFIKNSQSEKIINKMELKDLEEEVYN